MKGLCKVIGCRAGSPMDGVPASGYLFKFTDGNILVDCGPGVMLKLEQQEIDDLIAVIISHEHADHMLDLMALAYYLIFPTKRKRINLYAPDSVFDRLKKFDDTFGIPSLPMLNKPIALAFKWIVVIPGKSFSVNNHEFETVLMKHPVETIAIKSKDLQLVYTSDGAYTVDLYDFTKGCQILIAEATYPETGNHNLEEHGHMTAQICAELAERCNVPHLIVTHLSNPSDKDITLDIVKQNYNGIITLAYPGLEIASD